MADFYGGYVVSNTLGAIQALNAVRLYTRCFIQYV